MGRRLRLLFLLVVTVLLQVAVFPRLEIADAGPAVSLVATAAVGFRSGPESGLLFGFSAGLAVDLFLQTPLGLSALSYAVTGYAIGLVESGLVRSTIWVTPLIGGLAGLLGGLIFVTVGILAGQDQLIAGQTIVIVLVGAAYDMVVAPVVFPFARWAVRESVPGGAWRAR